MKNIIIAGLGIALALLVAGKAYSGNAEKIADLDWYGYGEVVRVVDGNTRCYIVTGTNSGGKSISCVRTK